MRKEIGKNYQSKYQLNTSQESEDISKLNTSLVTANKNQRNQSSISDDEKEFEKFIFHTVTDDNNKDDNDINNINLDNPFDNSVEEVFAPCIDKYNLKTLNLSTAINQAKKTYTGYIEGKNKVEKDRIKYLNKKERLKEIFLELKNYDMILYQEEAIILDKQISIENANNSLMNRSRKLKDNIIKFNYFYYKKKEDLEREKKNCKEVNESFIQRLIQLEKRKKDLASRQEKLKDTHKAFILQQKENDDLANTKQLEAMKDGCKSNQVLYEKIIKQNIKELQSISSFQLEKATYDHLCHLALVKQEEITRLTQSLNGINNEFTKKQQDNTNRIEKIQSKENELNALRNQLDNKIIQVEQTVKQTHMIAKDLKIQIAEINNKLPLHTPDFPSNTNRYTYELTN